MFGRLKKSAAARGRVGVAVTADEIAVAVVQRDGARPTLDRCVVLPLARGADTEAIAEALRAAGLPAAPVSTVLATGQYQLVQVEAPDVPPAELRAAMRWKLRDAIEFPVEDAIIDVFDAPPSSRGGQGRMVYAVAARRTAVDDHARYFPRNDRFEVIDIPELALRNLASLLPASAGGLAFMHLGEHSASVVLVRGGTFFFARQMTLQRDLGIGADGESTSVIDAASVALELQRSLDYYERQFDQPPISSVVIAPATAQTVALAAALATETGLSVSVFDINRQLQCTTPLDAGLQASSLLAIGAALRQERRTL